MSQIQGETSCVVNETYANSEAALAHAKGVALQAIPKILRVAKMTRIDVYGNPSEELQKVLTGAQTYNCWVQSLTVPQHLEQCKNFLDWNLVA